MRYTEARLRKIAEDMLADIDKDTVDYAPNYDGSKKEPSVMPSKIPNLLLNGTVGIAVGMATNMMPHNLAEVCDAAIRLIDKKGPLNNPADRDHCVQYVVALGLINGRLGTLDFEDDVAADPRIDALRKKMVVKENKHFTDDYEARHGNGNAIQVFFRDGSKTPRIAIEFSVGDPRRRREGVPLLEKKFRGNLARRYAKKQFDAVYALMTDQKKLEATPVNEFMDLLAE